VAGSISNRHKHISVLRLPTLEFERGDWAIDQFTATFDFHVSFRSVMSDSALASVDNAVYFRGALADPETLHTDRTRECMGSDNAGNVMLILTIAFHDVPHLVGVFMPHRTAEFYREK
jgi:hypothetical protein